MYINIPKDIVHIFLNDPPYALYNIDYRKVQSFLEKALNYGFERAYTLEYRDGFGLHGQKSFGLFLLYKHGKEIGTINYFLNGGDGIINFWGNTNEWQQNDAYFTVKVNEAIKRILEELQKKQRAAVAYSMRERLSTVNPYFEDRNATIQVMQYLGIHKPKPKNWIDILYPKPPKAGDKRKRGEF